MRARAAAGLLGVVLCSVLLAQAARFDYYILSLSWAPDFCAAADNQRECAAGRDMGFVVHGLWPEVNEGNGPESCGKTKPVAKVVVNFILPYMPSPGLIQHEWATHGTCTGMTPSSYFATVLQVRSMVQTPVQLTSLQEAVKEPPVQIEAQFEGSNASFPEGAFRAVCGNGELTEVRVCFDKELKPRVCPANAGRCAAASVTIRPPR